MSEILGYLRDLMRELNDIAEFTKGGEPEFRASTMIQKAVIRSYEVIGEIVKRIPDDLRVQHNQINWRKLAGFRDFLIHNYQGVDLGNVWAAVQDVPNLKHAVQAIIEKLES